MSAKEGSGGSGGGGGSGRSNGGGSSISPGSNKRRVDELVYMVDTLTREMPRQVSKKQKFSVRPFYIYAEVEGAAQMLT